MPKEFISIIGGIPPLVPLNGTKTIDKIKRVTPWVWHGFKNPSRKDGLKLYHWQRKEDTEKEYEYAQFNKKINVVEYSDEEYESLIKVRKNS